MLYDVVMVCVFKCMYCVAVVFMMQQLKSIGVLIHPNSDQLDMCDKVVKKVIMGGASMQGCCYATPHNIDTTLKVRKTQEKG